MARRQALGPRAGQVLDEAAEVYERTFGRPAVTRPPSLPESEFDESVEISRLENPAALTTELPGELKREPDYWYSFISSRVLEAGYDSESARLFVRFVKPRPMGTPWIYENVPPNVWRNFRRSESPGRYINRVLNNFNYHRGNF